MSYTGYRLKINNVTLPENFIGKGTYSMTSEDRIIDRWTDANLTDHVATIGTKRHTINFALRQHNSDEHSTFLQYVSSTKNVTVQYYDDETNAYVTGSFHIEGITFPHKTVRSGKIWYDEVNVTLEEY